MSAFLDQRSIDRLVDNELNVAERRALIALIAETPDGWRKLALSFLEAQAWGVDLVTSVSTGISSLPNSRREVPPALSIVAPRPSAIAEGESTSAPLKRKCPSLGRWLVAASLVSLVFASGFAMGDQLGRGRVAPASNLAASEPTPKLDPPSSDPVLEMVGRLELATDRSGEFAAGEIPIFSSTSLKSQWMSRSDTAIPESIRCRLEREGYQVEEQRSLMSVGLSDGREAVVPIDNVRVKYVGQTIY